MVRGFPELMKSQRKQLGISIVTLSDMLGISTRRLYRYESGDVDPSAVTFLKICYALKINPNIFMKKF